MDELDILALDFKRPEKRFATAHRSYKKPEPVPPPKQQLANNVAGARSDAELSQFLAENKDKTVKLLPSDVVVNFGSTWCHSCHAMFPHFYRLTSKFPGFKYVVAQIDYMHEAAQSVHYTPTFRFVCNGKTVDQFYGSSHQQLQDHLWLHSDNANSPG